MHDLHTSALLYAGAAAGTATTHGPAQLACLAGTGAVLLLRSILRRRLTQTAAPKS